MRVRKRDGSVQAWDHRKIRRAMLAACSEAAQSFSEKDVEAVQDAAYDLIDVDTLHDLVMKHLGGEAAEAYARYRQERDAVRTERLEPDPSAIVDYIVADKYAQHVNNRRETWDEAIDRVIAMHARRFPEIDVFQLFAPVRARQVLASMRSVQFGGKGVEQHNVRLYNCSFSLANRLRFFQELFYNLLCGCGCGFSVQFEHVAQLSMVQAIDETRVRHYSVPDTIEGWADSVGELIRSYFVTGDYVEFDYSEIRPLGSSLSTSGGKAPGHLPLKKLHQQLRTQLDACSFRKLRPIEVADIACKIGEAVLAGGIRRSSLIAIFSPEDSEMAHAKVPGNFEWQGKNYWRRMMNISASIPRNGDYGHVARRLVGLARDYGEPGVYWSVHPDTGPNPCGEIGLYPVLIDEPCEDRSLDYVPGSSEYGHNTGWQFCNVTEVNAAKCRTPLEFIAACVCASEIGTLQASYTDFPYLGPVTEEIVRRDALLGVSLTGMCDNPEIAFDSKVLREGAAAAMNANERLARRIGINPATRVTTIKPSGTASLVCGCVGSGIHPHHARRYFRRVTATPSDPVSAHFAKINPHMVEKKPDGNLCITFPVKAPDVAVTVKEEGALSFMGRVFNVYDNWILPGTREGILTHNVSCTVVVGEDEWDEVIEAAVSHPQGAMSFLPRFGDKGIPFMPREEVVTKADEAKWNHLIENYRPVDYSSMWEESDNTDHRLEPACAGGQCEV